jgi:hypothetical protein
MSYIFEKIDENLSDEEFLIEHRKRSYRKLGLLSEQQIDELMSTQDPKEHSKKYQKFVYLALEQKRLKNKELTI